MTLCRKPKTLFSYGPNSKCEQGWSMQCRGLKNRIGCLADFGMFTILKVRSRGINQIIPGTIQASIRYPCTTTKTRLRAPFMGVQKKQGLCRPTDQPNMRIRKGGTPQFNVRSRLNSQNPKTECARTTKT